MNTQLRLTIVFSFAYLLSNAQAYFPFPNSTTNAIWSVEYGHWGIPGLVPDGTTFYGIQGDTLISGISYVKVYWCGFPWTTDTSFNPLNATYQYGIRENNKQIYMRFFTHNKLPFLS